MSHQPKVLISLLNWNKFENTLHCIELLNLLEYSNYEIIVIDNNSQNNSVAEIQKKHPATKLIKSPQNRGYAAGHRLSVNYALQNNFDLIWVLNTDLQLKTNTLLELVAAYKRNNNAIFGSLVLQCENPDIIEYAGGMEMIGGKINEEMPYNRYKDLNLRAVQHLVQERETSDLHGCSWLVPTEIIKKYGFLDETFFLYAEETDYSYYLRTKGIVSIIVPTSIVVHGISASFEGNSAMKNVETYYRHRNFQRLRLRYFNVSKSKIIQEHGGRKYLIRFFISYILSSNIKKLECEKAYYQNLAALHAVLNIVGKTLKPEKYFI